MNWEQLKAMAAFLAMLATILVPVYLVMRGLLSLARIRYGFAPEPPDDGKPLRVCDGCANSILEDGYRHCPYCGKPLVDSPDSGTGTPGGHATMRPAVGTDVAGPDAAPPL